MIIIKQEDVFYILQDVRLGNLSEYEALKELNSMGVVIKTEERTGSETGCCPFIGIEPLIK